MSTMSGVQVTSSIWLRSTANVVDGYCAGSPWRQVADQPEEVRRGEHGPDARDHHQREEGCPGQRFVRLVGAEQSQHLAPEAGQARCSRD